MIIHSSEKIIVMKKGKVLYYDKPEILLEEMNGKKIETCSGAEAFKRIPQSKLIELKKRLFPQSTDVNVATLLNTSVGYSMVFDKIVEKNEDIEQQELSRIIVIMNMICLGKILI